MFFSIDQISFSYSLLIQQMYWAVRGNVIYLIYSTTEKNETKKKITVNITIGRNYILKWLIQNDPLWLKNTTLSKYGTVILLQEQT